MTGFKKCPSCFFKNAADAETCEQCTTELTGIAVSGSVVADAVDSLQSAEAAETPESAAGKSDQPLESAMPPPGPIAESSAGPPPPPADEADSVIESESTPPPVPPEEGPGPIAESSAGPPPPPADEADSVIESESTPPPVPPEEGPGPIAESSAGPPPPPEFADLPPAPPAGQTMQAAKSGSKLKVIAIVTATVLLLTATGVGAYALLNRGGAEVAVPDDQPEEHSNGPFDDPFNFDMDQDEFEFEPLEPEDELQLEPELEEMPPDDPPTGSGSAGTGSNTSSDQGQTTPSGVSGSGGSSDSTGQTLPTPLIKIYFEPHKPTVDALVTFSAAGSASSNPYGIITSYRWIFSDGVIGNDIVFQRRFDNRGLYVVELEVTDDQGETGRAMDWVTVSAADSGYGHWPGGSQAPGTGGTAPSGGNWWEVE